MPPSDVEFRLELLQAISDWQRDCDDRNLRTRRGQALKEAAANLPVRYREVAGRCFRQMSLDSANLWRLATETELPETISSWSTSFEVVQWFKRGVPPAGDWQGLIWTVLPSPDQVVINLEALFADSEFCEAYEAAAPRIAHFHSGMGRYEGTQREVVLEIQRLPVAAVEAMGGYSSDRERMARILFLDSGPGALAALDELLARAGTQLGPKWVTGAAKDRTLARMLDWAADLRRNHPGAY